MKLFDNNFTYGIYHDNSSRANNKNNMWAADKQMHFEAGAMTGSLTYAVVAETTNSKKKAFWYSMLATSMAGLAKELVTRNLAVLVLILVILELLH